MTLTPEVQGQALIYGEVTVCLGVQSGSDPVLSGPPIINMTRGFTELENALVLSPSCLQVIICTEYVWDFSPGLKGGKA